MIYKTYLSRVREYGKGSDINSLPFLIKLYEKGKDGDMQRDDFINEFGLYSRIQDHLMFLGNYDNMVAISVILILYQKNRKRESYDYFHSEVQYFSETMCCETRKIKRSNDCYILMENARPIGTYREVVTLRAKDLELMYLTLLPKFEYIIANFDKIYQGVGDKMQVTNFIKPFMIEIGMKSLIFQPGINKTFTDELAPTIDMFMNGNESNKISMSFNQVYSFMYLIRRFNLFEYAANMMNYLGRPPAGTNLIDMVDSRNYNQVEAIQFSDPTKRRFIGGTERKKSYFSTHDGNKNEK